MMVLNGCIRNTTAACGNVATGLLLRPYWLVHFLELDKVCMYEEMMTNTDNLESSLPTLIY